MSHYDNEIAAAIVDASDRLVKGFHEFVFHGKVGDLIDSVSRIADGLERIADNLEGVKEELESIASSQRGVADALDEIKQNT